MTAKKQQNAFQKFFRAVLQPVEETLDFDKFDETISPNMRALRLSLNIADTLIAMGVSVADVVSQSLDVTDRYCRRNVQFDISSTLITVSQDRGDDREPLTLVRHAQPRTTNYMTVQSISELIHDIRSGNCSLADAEKRFDSIQTNPKKYPYWLTVCGSGFISAGIGVLYGATPIIIAIMFVLTALVTYVLRILAHRRIPIFFAQIVASVLIVLIAAGVRKLDQLDTFTWLNNVNPSLIIIGGIITLVAGLAIVSAVEDAIDEFYVTANARLLKVTMLTVGIVAGVLLGMYFAKRFGVYISGDTVFSPKLSPLQYLGAFFVASGYALSMQSRVFSILLSGLLGMFAWYTFSLSLEIGGALAAVVASATAATCVGAAGTIAGRIWHIPSVALMTAGIVILVPGLTLYNSLFSLVSGGYDGLSTLFEAVLIALAIASGVSFGHLIARPVGRTLVRARNALPRRPVS